MACDGPIGMRAAMAVGLSRFLHKLPYDTSHLSNTCTNTCLKVTDLLRISGTRRILTHFDIVLLPRYHITTTVDAHGCNFEQNINHREAVTCK